jgi:hypothetical protein
MTLLKFDLIHMAAFCVRFVSTSLCWTRFWKHSGCLGVQLDVIEGEKRRRA